MFAYYIHLAVRSLKRNVALTAFMIIAVGVGIGVCMTALTTLRVMSGNPIPDKSSELYVPHINAWDPARGRPGTADSQFSYRDAMALMKAHRGVRQAAMYQIELNIKMPSGRLEQVHGRATFADFFPMFDVPFRSGGAWGAKQDDDRENVVVLSAKLANRLFPHIEPLGQAVTLTGQDYRVVGVIRPWTLTPRFYDLADQDADQFAFGETEDFFLPFATAIDRQIIPHNYTSCMEEDRQWSSQTWAGRLNSGCYWVQFWVQLPTATQVRDFKTFVQGYASAQQRLGLYHYPARVQMLDVMDWLAFNEVNEGGVRVNMMIATCLLVVCLVNAVGLMLARFASKIAELGVRRALGASQVDLFMQCFAETLIMGLLSAGLGLALTAAGLWGIRVLRGVARDSAAGHLYSLDAQMALIVLVLAVMATMISGIYPALRAVRTQPAWQLKIQ
ncbi:MAG TPA: ABC transporter permease [Steroidobacteraceae bacterium]